MVGVVAAVHAPQHLVVGKRVIVLVGDPVVLPAGRTLTTEEAFIVEGDAHAELDTTATILAEELDAVGKPETAHELQCARPVRHSSRLQQPGGHRLVSSPGTADSSQDLVPLGRDDPPGDGRRAAGHDMRRGVG